MAIPVPTAELLGTFLEALGYGVYLVVFPQCLRIMLRKQLSNGLMAYFFVTVIVNFLLITLHIVVDLTRAFSAFTANMDVGGAAEAYYATVNTSLNLTKNASYVSATLVADALLLYRTFIVWGRNVWVIVVPVLIFMLDIAMSVWFTWSVNEARPMSSVLVSSVFARSKYFFAATLALNLLCTVLIAYKIWKIQRKVGLYAAAPTRGASALSIIFESAAIYSAALICLIGTSVSDSSTMFFFLNSMPPLIGSVFSYIVLRSSTDITRFNTTLTTPSAMHDSLSARTGRHYSTNINVPPPTDIDGVHVHLQRIVHHDESDLKHSVGSFKVDNKLMTE